MTGIRTSIYKAHQAWSAAYEAELSTAGLNITPQQATVLCAIAGMESPSQTDLVDATGVDRSTMADVVRRLSSKGLLTRKRTRS
ncbi:MAG TPA: helix-turn-helix domain-containing protein, partial [Azoarcus taiwanensis]|nr:helix-turn-helix domain-containing protein [Azoarcus taiwanensis]